MTSRRLVFLGPPGAGKGTQASSLAAEKGLLHLSTGDMLRAERREGTELGGKAAALMDEGRLVPDGLVIEVLLSRLSRPDAEGGWILDGFPRTLPQAEALSSRLHRREQAVERVVSFEIPEDALVARLSGRLTCGGCGAVYNSDTNPPRQEGVCDRCGGGSLDVRPDDRPEAVRRRLKVYREQSEPLVEYYRGAGLLVEVDAGRSVGEVHQDLLELVG